MSNKFTNTYDELVSMPAQMGVKAQERCTRFVNVNQETIQTALKLAALMHEHKEALRAEVDVYDKPPKTISYTEWKDDIVFQACNNRAIKKELLEVLG